MTNQQIATLTTSIVTNIVEYGGTPFENIHKIISAYRDIYATIKDVDRADGKDHKIIIEKQLGLLVQTNDLLFLQIMNSPINSPLNNMLLDALNKNIQTILTIVD